MLLLLVACALDAVESVLPFPAQAIPFCTVWGCGRVPVRLQV